MEAEGEHIQRKVFFQKHMRSDLGINNSVLVEYKCMVHACYTTNVMRLVIQDRLTAWERTARWCPNINTTCVLCQATMETRNHLFFSCGNAAQVQCLLMIGLLGDDYSTDWNIITTLVEDSTNNNVRLFIIRYIFQATVHCIWRERNGRRYGTKLSLPLVLEKQPRFWSHQDTASITHQPTQFFL